MDLPLDKVQDLARQAGGTGPALAALLGGSLILMVVLQRAARLLTDVVRGGLWAAWLGGAAAFLWWKGRLPAQAALAFAVLVVGLFLLRGALVKIGASKWTAALTGAGGLWGLLSAVALLPSGAALAGLGAWEKLAALPAALLFIQDGALPQAILKMVPLAQRTLVKPYLYLGLPLLLGAVAGLLLGLAASSRFERSRAPRASAEKPS